MCLYFCSGNLLLDSFLQGSRTKTYRKAACENSAILLLVRLDNSYSLAKKEKIFTSSTRRYLLGLPGSLMVILTITTKIMGMGDGGGMDKG